MLQIKPPTTSNERGVTLVELVIVLSLTLVIGTAFYTFFKTNLFTYLNLQKDASNFTDLAGQSQRIGNVLRGLTDITDVQDDEMTLYGYFFPTDTYVSLIRYYKSTDGKKVYADVTQMTSNPPLGTTIPSSKKTYTIISNFKNVSGVKLFEYLDSSGAAQTLPISDLHSIKGLKVNLAVSTATNTTNQAVSVQVSLRNRKTNL